VRTSEFVQDSVCVRAKKYGTMRAKGTENGTNREVRSERNREIAKKMSVWARERDMGEGGEREGDWCHYIIIQTYDVGLHSRRNPMEFDAGTREREKEKEREEQSPILLLWQWKEKA